jgi:ribosomal protein S12 methylthiotransferase accessory factor
MGCGVSTETSHARYSSRTFIRLPRNKDCSTYFSFRHQAIYWSFGFCPLTKTEYFVPSDYILFPRSWEKPFQIPGYRANTDGIASGTAPSEAICAGVYEVVERHAIARVDINSGRRVNEDTLPESLHEFTDRFKSAGVDLSIIYCQTLISFPTFYVLSRDDITNESMFFCSGSGCHNRPDTALLRALLEVSQSRASFISGIRPDVGKRIARLQNNNYRAAADYFRPWFDFTRTISFHDIPFSSAGTFNEMLRDVVCRLHGTFGPNAIVCSILADSPGLYACRVLCPQLFSGDV